MRDRRCPTFRMWSFIKISRRTETVVKHKLERVDFFSDIHQVLPGEQRVIPDQGRVTKATLIFSLEKSFCETETIRPT